MDLALLALALLFLSQPAVLIRWAQAPIEAIGFWRMLAAALLLAPLAWRSRASWRALDGGGRLRTLAAGLLFFAHLWTFVYAAQNTTVANAMTAFSTHPLWTGAGAWLLLGERPTRRLFAAYALAAAGIAALVGGSVALSEAGLAGDLAALGSAALFSGYVLVGRGVRRRLDNAAYAAAVYAVVAACFFASGSLRGVPWTGYGWNTWGAVLGLAAGVTLGGHALFTLLLARMDVNVLSCAKLLEPIGASLTAWLVFSEPLRPRTGLAFALIAAGVLVLLLPAGRAVPAEPAALEE